MGWRPPEGEARAKDERAAQARRHAIAARVHREHVEAALERRMTRIERLAAATERAARHHL
jgi:hypothetical protein